MVGNLRKRKVDCSKRLSEKKRKKMMKNGLEKKMKRKKRNISVNWVSLYKVSVLDVIKKKKLCSTSL